MDYRPAECVESLEELMKDGRTFGTLMIDPPWQYSNQSTRGATDDHYLTLTPKQIIETFAEPVRSLTATNAHLHLWTTNAFLFESKDILEAFGFTYRSILLWIKPQIGMGNYYRVSHEYLILGTKGHAPFPDNCHDIASWISAPRGRHSDKPDVFRHIIERISPAPYLELFGRRPVPGWVVYGNEIDQENLFYQGIKPLILTEEEPAMPMQLSLIP